MEVAAEIELATAAPYAVPASLTQDRLECGLLTRTDTHLLPDVPRRTRRMTGRPGMDLVRRISPSGAVQLWAERSDWVHVPPSL